MRLRDSYIHFAWMTSELFSNSFEDVLTLLYLERSLTCALAPQIPYEESYRVFFFSPTDWSKNVVGCFGVFFVGFFPNS